MYSDMAGIDMDPEHPGFSHINYHPEVGGGLKWLKASLDTVHGTIKSEWHHENGKLTVNVTIPDNTTAKCTILMDADAPAEAFSASPGVGAIQRSGNTAVFEIGAGSYTFTTKYTGN